MALIFIPILACGSASDGGHLADGPPTVLRGAATVKSLSSTVQSLDLTTPGYVAGADANGDGYGDIVIASGPMAYVFLGNPSGITPSPWQIFTLPTGRAGRVFSAGDMNGDGYDDVVFTRPNAMSGRGVAYLCMGQSTGIQVICRRMAGTASPSGLGVAVAAGDFDADGYSDVAIERADGWIDVYAGSSDTVSVPVAWATLNPGPRTVTGRDLAAGDVDGDGHDDIVVGVYDGESVDGAVQVWFGSYPLLNGYQNVEYPWAPASTGGYCGDGGSMGYSVGVPGDVDGDGYDDILTGAPYDLYMCTGGYAYLFYGTSSGPEETYWSEFVGNASAYDHFSTIGMQSGGRADYNGDGYADLTYGDSKLTYLNGSSAGFPLTSLDDETTSIGTLVVELSTEAIPRFWTVGDINGDGRDEVLAIVADGSSTRLDVYFGAP